MKKIVFLAMLLLIMSVGVFANTTHGIYQKVIAGDPGVDILTLVTSTATSYTAPNYTISAYVVGRESEVLQTGVTPTTSLRLYRQTASNVTIFIQAATWTTQWVVNDVIHVTVTKTDVNQTVNFEFVNTGGANQNITTPVSIPPLLVTNPNPLPATLVAPAMNAIDVPHGTVHLDWDWVHTAGYSDAVGYRVKYGTDPTLAVATTVYTVESFFDIFTEISTDYYWQVIPTTLGAKKGATKGDAVNCPIWHFDTDNPVVELPNTINPTAPGAFTYPSTNPLNSIGITFGGTVNAPGTIVFGEIIPAKAGTYHGYLHVEHVYTATASDQAMLNGATLNFNFNPAGELNYKYVAIHWGGVNNGYYPVNNPETAGVPTPGYYFNGGVSQGAGWDFPLGVAPFTGAGYAAGVLTIGPIPAYTAKDAGVFEIILGTDLDLPVELSSFAAVATAQMFVNLAWTTESETNSLGFNVLRSEDNNINNAIRVNYQIIGGTNTSTTQNYTYVDNTVEPQTTYYYWLEMVNNDLSSTFSNYVMVTTNPTTPVVPTANATVLRSAYPNPFRLSTSTTIAFDVKTGETASLTIYNVLGQVVKTYSLQAGPNQLITWNGRDDKGAVCGSGIYFYKLSSTSSNTTKKMVIVK